MEVRVKNQIVSKASISSISYNQHYNLLAVVADGNDTTSFFVPTADLSLKACFAGQSKPPSSGIVSWSPNGHYIAVANIKVELWKFDGTRMSPLRIINEGYVEIKCISWSQDSQYYLCCGINPKQSALCVNIRHIESNELKQIFVKDIAILASFDPFGKYIAILNIKNMLQLYDARTLDKTKSVSLAQCKNDIPTLRDKRTTDWSPQYSFFVAPNLNDSRIQTAITFDRNSNFACKDILLGHQATLSCLRFNPHIFQFQADNTFILAVGDSSGCLSIWRIGKSNSYHQPLFIFSSPNKAEQSIQGLQWNKQGNILFVNVLKKYIVVIQFRLQDFGNKLKQQQKNNIIIATYGASGANQITGNKLQVFGQSDFSFKDQVQAAITKQVQPVQRKFQEIKPKQAMVLTKQQTIIKKQGNKEKKRIIPSRTVPQSELKNNQNNAFSHANSNPANIATLITGQSNQLIQKPKQLAIKLPLLKQQLKREYALPTGEKLLYQQNKLLYILSIKSEDGQNKVNSMKRFFNHEIKQISITRNNILILSGQNLYIFSFDLHAEQLPFFLGLVSNLTVNNSGTVFYLLSNGLIRGFNYLKHQFILETSLTYLLLSSEENQINVSPLSMFVVFDDDNDRLHVQLKNNLFRYFYSKQNNSWVQFDFNEGFYLPGHSLRITTQNKKIADNFYLNLVAPVISNSQQNKSQASVSQYEMQLIYYSKYAKDAVKFKEALIKNLADLKAKGNQQQLRKSIIKYFKDVNSADYINDIQLWQKVKKIGGKVIQQFLILNKL